MDFFINKVSQQAVSFAIRSGITVTTTFAYHQIGRYISSTRGKDRQELQSLKERLQTKIDIISPAIDLIEIISARGNTSLESALTLTKAIRHDIESLGVQLSNLSSQSGGRKRPKSQDEIKAVMQDIRNLLRKIEDAVPFINLAVTTSGVELSSNIPHNVSPSRLLQASTLLTAGDTAYALNPFDPAQIGTTFTLSLYMLFSSHSHRQEHVSAKDLTWQEVIYKCRVKLQRVPLVYDEEDAHSSNQLRARAKIDEYCYELCLIEDLDDGRVHEEEEESTQPPGSYEDISRAGLRTRIPIHQITKLFYTNSGTLLGIEDSNSPILLIKRDLNAPPPRKLMDRVQQYHDEYQDSEEEEQDYALDMGEGRSFWDTEEDGQILPAEYDLPRHLDPEWLALQVFTEPIEDEDGDGDGEEDGEGDEEDEDEDCSEYGSREGIPIQPVSPPPASVLDTGTLVPTSSNVNLDVEHIYSPQLPPRLYNSKNVKSNLSVLECLLRLTILQNYQQASHLAVHDELLNLFLSDSALSGSRESRQFERENARRRIGFDPFGSPEKPKPRRSPEEEPMVGSTKPTDTPLGEGPHGHHGGRRSTPQRLVDSLRRDSGYSMISSSNMKSKGLSTSNIPSPSPGTWTPEQQLSSMFENSYTSSPSSKK